MPVLRKQNKHDNFVILDKYFLQDKKLSLKAKGLLSYLLSLPNDWEPRPNELANHFKDGIDAIRSTINELIKAGYITSYKERTLQGQFSKQIYIIHETPQYIPHKEPPGPDEKKSVLQSTLLGKPHRENPDLGKTELLSNNSNNNINKLNTAAVKIQRNTQSVQKKPAAVNDFSLIEKRIGKILTQDQHEFVSQVAQELSLKYTCSTPQKLQREIEFTLLDPHSYTQADKDFFKKLNTIKKAIREHKWHQPVRYGNRKRISSVIVNYCPGDPMKAMRDEIERLEDYRRIEINVLHTSPMARYQNFRAATQTRIDKFSKQISKLKNKLSNTYRVQKHAI